MTIRIPVLLLNTGARTRLVGELRLIAPAWDPGVFEWQTFHATVRPQEEDIDDFAAPYAINGRETALRFVKFTLALTNTLPEPTDTTLRLEARLDGSDRWVAIKTFTLHLAHMKDPAYYITYRNSPDPCEGEPSITRTAWKARADKAGLEAPWSE